MMGVLVVIEVTDVRSRFRYDVTERNWSESTQLIVDE